MQRDPTVMRAVGVVGRLTALSRLFGLLRDLLMAHMFGASHAASAFYVAFRLPNLMRRLFGEGALAAAFVPVFSKRLESDGPAAAAQLAGRLLGLLTAGLGLLTAGLWLLMWGVEPLLAADGRWAAVLPLGRIMLPYGLLICQAALLMGMLNVRGRFALPASAPVLLNLVWIVALLASRQLVGENAAAAMRLLAWAVLLAGALQAGILTPSLYRLGLMPRWRPGWRRDPDIARILRLMAPAALGMGAVQINVFLDGVLAMAAAPWAPAALFFAERLVYLPLGLFATAMGTVLLPTFSRQIAQQDREAFDTTFRHAWISLITLMAPAAILLLALSTPTVGLIFAWRGGQFDAVDLARTARALACYAPGLLVFSLYKAITPAFHARQDTRTPARIALIGVGLNLCLNLLAVLTLPVEWRHAGMALSTVLSSSFNVGMLLAALNRSPVAPDWRALRQPTGHILGAALLCGLATTLLAPLPGRWISSALWGGKALQLATLTFAGSAGAALYLALIRRHCPTGWEVIRQLARRSAKPTEPLAKPLPGY